MHTVITAFKDRAAAQAAMDRLAASGFARQDMHLEDRDVHGEGDRGPLENYGAFFASVLGMDDPSSHADTYSQHVERGSCVLVVDTKEPLDAQRCNALMREMGGTDTHLADRTGAQHRSIRDIVADRQVTMTGMTSH
jgi:hypothetical protein